MNANREPLLAQWYYENYTVHKNYSTETATRVAGYFSSTIFNFNCRQRYEFHVGHLRGILGEVLSRAALDYLAPRHFNHHLSPLHLDSIGIDISVTNGNPNIPILGFGIKLGHGGSPKVIKDLPTLNLHVRPDLVGVDRMILRQQEEELPKPTRFIQELYAERPELEASFLHVLRQQCTTALTSLNTDPFPIASKYLHQLI